MKAGHPEENYLKRQLSVPSHFPNHEVSRFFLKSIYYLRHGSNFTEVSEPLPCTGPASNRSDH
jgi:hypothetical protein